MFNRSIRSILLLMVVISLIVGCSKNESGVNATPKEKQSNTQVTLRYMIWNQTQAPTYQKIIDAFEKQNPNIHVQLQVIPWANFWDSLMTQIAGGNAPDVFWGYLPRVPSFIQKGALLDISKYIKRDNIDLSLYNKSILNAYQDNGKTYSIPEQWNSQAIYYNKDLLKKAGIDSYPDNLTWNPKDGGSFVHFLQKLTIDKNGHNATEKDFDPKHIVQYGFNYIDKDQVDPGQFIGFVASNGGTILKNSKLRLDDKLSETYQFIYDLTYKYHVAPSYTEIRTGGSEAKFDAQQIAVWMDGNWMMKPIKEKATFNWGIAKIPEGPQGRKVLVAGMGDVIYSKTKHPEESWKFLKFISGKEGQDIIGSSGGYFPGLADSIPQYINYYKNLGIDATPFVDEYKGDTVASPVALNYDAWYNEFVKYTSIMLSGGMDPQKTLKQLKESGDKAAAEQ